jgi:MutS domain V
MKAYLMHRDRDLDLARPLPANEAALSQDLELNVLCNAMAAGDQFLFDIAKRTVLTSLTDPDAVGYRQRVLADCLDRQPVVRAIYDLAVEAIEEERRIWGWIHPSPDTVLSRAVKVLELFVPVLKRLRATADEHAAGFHSDGFGRFFGMLATELDDDYFRVVEGHLKELAFRRGVLQSARLGKGNKGTGYVLRRPPEQSWLQRLAPGSRSGHTFQIPDRDEAGYQALSDLRGRGINLVANALAQSTDHILSFFQMLRAELGFYVGCLNLHARLTEKGEPTCLPEPAGPGDTVLSARGLYDPALSLTVQSTVVGNDIDTDGKDLVVITGANQGGKSTFLRAVGVAQLMMQCGMLVPAEAFRANCVSGVYTHFKREEDATMRSGKLDEELRRMSEIADLISRNGMLLCNESFASTNEREGSEIARQVVRALTESGVKVFFVTHLFDLADRFHRDRSPATLFLRAERHPDGRRTFKLVEGEPLPTSFGEDLYRRIFGATLTRGPAAALGR